MRNEKWEVVFGVWIFVPFLFEGHLLRRMPCRTFFVVGFDALANAIDSFGADGLATRTTEVGRRVSNPYYRGLANGLATRTTEFGRRVNNPYYRVWPTG